MPYTRIATVLGAALVGLSTAIATSTPALAGYRGPTVLVLGQIDEQDVPPAPGSEPDTLVEPDIAVSPTNPNVAIAVAHDGRYPDGGAVAISYAWTHDGGRSWHHAPVPKLTKAVGGAWDRASDPVAAFGPDGTAYISTLLISADCPSGVGVSRSTDGGRTFGAPVLAHQSTSCGYSDDKNWLVVDTGRHSPYRGRLYQFWTPFFADAQGNPTGSAQVLRWSDDQGRHWGPTVNVSATNIFTQGSQPMIQPDGTITDAYLNFGTAGGGEGPDRPAPGAAPRPSAPSSSTPPASTPPASAPPAQRPAAAVVPGDLLVARTSYDGGRTWSPEATITHDVGAGPQGVRCCLPSATADPVTGLLYAAWDSATPGAVDLAVSADGRQWSKPTQVNRDDRAGLDHVNVDVAAYGGTVFVSYGTRDTAVENGRYVQQQVSTSYDAGAHFGPELSLGPPSDLRYAAVARGLFPGDYIGSAATRGRTYLVWCRSSTPPNPSATYHQTVYAAVLRP